MEHQPFETLITTDEALSAAQERDLQAHLASCAQCRTLQTNWQALRSQLQAAPAAQPAPGFTRRWQASLAERRALQAQMQVRRWLLGFGTATGLGLIGGLVWLVATTSIADWLVNGMRLALIAVTDLYNLRVFVSSWLNVIPLSIPLTIWALLSTGFAIIVVGWLFTLWRVSTQGVENK